MENGTKWGLIGIIILISYFIVSATITAFISKAQIINIIVLAAGIFFALLTVYAGSMAYKNNSKIFGAIDILLGMAIVVIMIASFLRILASMIGTMPTF